METIFFFLACCLSSFVWSDIEAKNIQYNDKRMTIRWKNFHLKSNPYLQFFCPELSGKTKFSNSKEEQLSSKI